MKEEILKSYDLASNDYGYNSNSLHKLGLDARKLEDAASDTILNTLHLTDYEVIYTSGNAESLSMLEINNIDKDKVLNLVLGESYNNLNNYDFIIIEDDIPFIGALIKRKNIYLENLIHGGKSTTVYRSGTSPVPLIASFAKLVKLKHKK